LEAEVQFRVAGPGDEKTLTELFADIDETFFRPHPFTAEEADRLCNYSGRDLYVLLIDGDRPVAYGMLRGWDEEFDTPYLGIAVRSDSQGHGYGRLMMAHLHTAARERGAERVRLRVHPDNVRARHLYETLGYEYLGEDRGELGMGVDLGSRK
jgi:[ribosomal protein S18]-alanine N-acetyltransferase